MTSFLPESPRRRWHPSEWNIARVGSALGATLAIAGCPNDTTSAATEASDETNADENWEEENYTDYSEYTEWTDYSDYSDYAEYSDWDDDYTDWYYECYVDEDCGPGMQCTNGYCVPLGECTISTECEFDQFCDPNGYCVTVDLSAQCLAPALQEIPLPEEAGGAIVGLRFVELHGDPGQELVLLRDDAIVVVDGDQAISVMHSAFELDGLAATDIDDDGALDLVATSSTKLNSRVFFADGMGGFFDGGVGPGMRLDHVHGIDWPEFGSGELLARAQGGAGVILSDIAQLTPVIDPVEPGPIDALVAGDFDGNGTDNYAVLAACQPFVRQQGGSTIGSDAVGPPGSCSMVAGSFDGDAQTDLVTLRTDETFSVVTVHAPFGESYFTVGLIGAYQAAVPTHLASEAGAVLIQTGVELEYLFADQMQWSWCRGALDELPPVQHFASGDLDGDGNDELAVIDSEGAVTLWSSL